MNLKRHFELLAIYNQWMNSKLYEAAGHLNHILVGDTIWLNDIPAWLLIFLTTKLITGGRLPLCCHRRVWISGLRIFRL